MNNTREIPPLNLYLKSYRQDPYSYLKEIREIAPIYQIKGPNVEWFLTRYQDVKSVISGKDFAVDDLPYRLLKKNELIKKDGNLNALSESLADWMIFNQPPEHTRLRKPMASFFTPRKLEQMRQFIEDDIAVLFAGVKEKGQMEFVRDIAKKLPLMTSFRLLGMPMEDYDMVYKWTNCLVDIFDQPNTLESYLEMNQTTLEFNAYFTELIAHKRRNPDDKLISYLVTLNDSQQIFTPEELLATCSFLITAAQESTEAFLGNSVLALLNHPDESKWLVQNSDKIALAVEELLRFDPPIQMLVRIPLTDVSIMGQTIRAGERILTSLAAANHDPEEFEAPAVLNLSRPKNNNIAFGYGIHTCIGAWLARLEGQVLFNSLLHSFPVMERTNDQLSWYPNVFIRGLKELHIKTNTN